MLLDEPVGAAEIDRLVGELRPPCRMGDLALEGVIARTETALIFIARARDKSECVVKLTGCTFRPLLEHELLLLKACRAADLRGVVRPLQDDLLVFEARVGPLVAIVLPFLAGGDLVQWIGTRSLRTGRLGAGPALEVAEIVGRDVREMLRLPQPIVHGDIKPQNLLLPCPDAPLDELTLIDLDASTALETPLAAPSREAAQQLVGDVNGFGDLLYMLATGREPPPDDEPNPMTGNASFDALVVHCITAEVGSRGYTSMAAEGLWRDLDHAVAEERRRSRDMMLRPVLAGIGIVLFGLLIVALLSKVAMA